jgi:hypothetical protein
MFPVAAEAATFAAKSISEDSRTPRELLRGALWGRNSRSTL